MNTALSHVGVRSRRWKNRKSSKIMTMEAMEKGQDVTIWQRTKKDVKIERKWNYACLLCGKSMGVGIVGS